jgi:hypothetical protein
MSLLDTASLIVTPNAYKEDKLYSVVPSDGSGDMSVVRATTATRVNSAGLVELVPYNLVQYSEQFNNAAWTKTDTTVTANATTAPDGTLTADRLIESATTNTHRILQSISTSGTNTYSIYVKYNGRRYFGIRFFADASNYSAQLFDVQNGVIGNKLESGITSTATMTSVGNGWYRCSIVANVSSINFLTFLSTTNVVDNAVGNVYTGDGTSGVFLWGAQAELGLITTYQRTETRLNIPRLDYSNGSCPSLLVEPQRTNLLQRSEDFSNAYWFKNALTITTNTVTAPNGTLTADSIVENTANTDHYVSTAGSLTLTAAPYTFSIYCKKATRDWININLYNGTDVKAAWFNLNTGTIGTVQSGLTASITDVGNGWYRCSITRTMSTGINYCGISPQITDNGGTYLGNGLTAAYIWGAQLELGSYATSYIATTSASVTRNADVIFKTGISSLIGQTEGTLFCEIKLQNVNSASTYVGMTSGTFANGILIGKEAGVTPNKLVFYIFANGSAILNNTSIALSSSFVKCAIAYKSGNWAAYANGSLVASGTSTFTFSASVNRFGFGSNAAFAALDDEIEVKQTAIWKTRLTNAELAQLTTI